MQVFLQAYNEEAQRDQLKFEDCGGMVVNNNIINVLHKFM